MTEDQQPIRNNTRARVHPGEKEGYVKIEADVPVEAVQEKKDNPPASSRPEPEARTLDAQTPPPGRTTATVAGYGVDDILKAPFQPPAPKPGEHGPAVTEKMNQTTYRASKRVGPERPGLVNLVLVGLGMFICLLGLLGFMYFSLGTAMTILVIGFVMTAVGAFLKL